MQSQSFRDANSLSHQVSHVRIQLHSPEAFRKFLMRSMMRSALASRIITTIYSFRNTHSSSYILASFVFFAVSLSSYVCRGLATPGTVSSYSGIWLEYLSPLLMLCCAFREDRDEPFDTNDRVEELGGSGARVAAYLRVSTGRQAKEGSSLAAQREQLDKLKDELKPSRIYWFVDAGKSGVNFDGRKTNSIMQLAEEGKIEELWVTQIDRIGRECTELLLFFLNLSKKGVVVRTPERVYRTKELSGVLIYVVEASGAEEENRRRAKSTMASKAQRFRAKRWNKVAVPLGYQEKDNWLERKPNWEPLITESYDLFSVVRDLESTRRQLNRKYQQLLPQPLTRYQLKSILSDPIYVGRPQHLGEIVHDPNLAYVNERKFGEVQEAIKHIQDRRRPKKDDPVKELVNRCGISVLEFLDQLQYIHKNCGGILIKNGTRLIGGLVRQNMLCKKCRNQWVVPSNTQLRRLKEFFFGENGSDRCFKPGETALSIYPLVSQSSDLSQNLREPDKLGRRERRKEDGKGENQSVRGRKLEEFE